MDTNVTIERAQLTDLVFLARQAADELELREPGSVLADCLKGSAANIIAAMLEPVPA